VCPLAKVAFAKPSLCDNRGTRYDGVPNGRAERTPRSKLSVMLPVVDNKAHHRGSGGGAG